MPGTMASCCRSVCVAVTTAHRRSRRASQVPPRARRSERPTSHGTYASILCRRYCERETDCVGFTVTFLTTVAAQVPSTNSAPRQQIGRGETVLTLDRRRTMLIFQCRLELI